jgi:proteasome lid subunit RPN8/RPN11
MNDAKSRSDESIDVRLLARQDLPLEAFPGGSTEGFRVFFTHEVHAALWQHASGDTTVEICGVLVGTWHRDQVGPFVKIVESIRGEGAETRFAEVTFTHQTWSKINAEMDTKFAHLSIVGWYHTHPDFGIFLSDRDRFIQEHFFSGPGQIAHVIDPIRKIEGAFVWRDGKPCLTEHFWVGDRILVTTPGTSDGGALPEPDARSGSPVTRGGGRPPAGSTAQSTAADTRPQSRDVLPPPGRMIIYGLVFLLGYMLANILSAWEHQRFVESVLASNGFIGVLRLGLSDELDRVRGDLAAIVGTLEAVRAKSEKADEAVSAIRAQLGSASQRIAAIKAQYGNSPSEDAMLIRMVQEKMNRMSQSRESSVLPEPKAGTPSPPSSAPPRDATSPKETGDAKIESATPNVGAPVKP